MSNQIMFTIFGELVAQGRPKFSTFGGNVRTIGVKFIYRRLIEKFFIKVIESTRKLKMNQVPWELQRMTEIFS